MTVDYSAPAEDLRSYCLLEYGITNCVSVILRPIRQPIGKLWTESTSENIDNYYELPNVGYTGNEAGHVEEIICLHVSWKTVPLLKLFISNV